ncbi:MAG: hypothetical protein ACRDUB_00870 [Mycobacterium sp.]
MELRWWVIAAVAAVCLVGAAAAAWLLPVARVQRQLRPLAHVGRLTELPEFARVHRIYVVSMAITSVLLLVGLSAAVMAAARPQEPASDGAGYDAAHPVDLMICVAQSVTDPTSADLFGYYADQAKTFTNQQIGITSINLRAMPMTRDHGFAEQRLRYFAGLAATQQALDTGKDVPLEQRLELSAGLEAFSRRVLYTDYAPTVEDALALCMAGFPELDSASEHRRQLVYIGYSRLRSDNETRPALYDQDQLQGIASRGGIQINAISRADVAETSQKGNDMLRALTQATGGRFTLYSPTGTASSGSDGGDVLTAALDGITANPPPPGILGDGNARYVDSPQVALVVAVSAVMLLSVAMLGLRR